MNGGYVVSNLFNFKNFQEQFKQQESNRFKARHSINGISKLEQYTFEDRLASDKKLAAVDKKGNEQLKTFGDMELDLYSALFQSRPEVNDNVGKPFKINKKIVERIMDTDEYIRLRKFTKLNRNLSAEVASDIAEQALTILTEEQKKKINEQYQAGGWGNGDSDDDQDQNGTAQQQGEGEDKDDQGNDQEGNSPTLSEQEIEDILKKAVKASGGKMKELADEEEQKEQAVKTFGTDDGNMSYTSPEQAQKIMERIKKSRILQEVTKMAGRMKSIAKKIRAERTIEVREEVYDLEMGNDLSKLLPSEYAMLAGHDEVQELLFLKRFAEGQLLQYKFRGKEDKAKGPIVMLIDRSGSMGGENEIWARAIMIAMQDIAKQDNRDLHLVYYDHRVFKEILLPMGRATNTDEWMAFVGIGSDGGTNFETPLNRAVEIIEKHNHMHQADIVMISDGECHIDEQKWLRDFNAKKEKLGFKAIGVLVGYGGEIMKKFCDTMVLVSDINKDSDATQAIFSV